MIAWRSLILEDVSRKQYENRPLHNSMEKIVVGQQLQLKFIEKTFNKVQ
jgi:hypothetical protein